ncbi:MULTISPECIES: FtsX-like permease family protein [unclassified Brachybacterium]|uniref:FtsX-like permease family protein n=1 Tax=unclassified Brachybacterium TaxID=2623841 RepID=UPI003614044E
MFVPRGLLTDEQFWQIGGVQATITTDPREDLVGDLANVGIDAHSGWDIAEFDRLQHSIDTIRLLTVTVLAIGLGGFLLSMTDRALERSGDIARLRLLGTPVRTLRAAHWFEVTVPLVVGVLAALAIGHVVASTYVAVGNLGVEPGRATNLPDSYLVGPVLAALVGSVLIAALTSMGLGMTLRSEQIRRE